MGRAGRTGKPAGKRHGHHEPRVVLELAPAAKAHRVPAAPKGLLASTRREWREFWRSDIAVAVRRVDYPTVVRYVRLLDTHERALAALWDPDEGGEPCFELMTAGSTGQPRVNPILDYLLKLEKQILAIAAELGTTPLARARLGVQLGEANERAAAMNARIKEQARRRAEEGAQERAKDSNDVDDVEFEPV